METVLKPDEVQWEEIGEGRLCVLRACVDNRHAHVYPSRDGFVWFLDGGPISGQLSLEQAKHEAATALTAKVLQMHVDDALADKAGKKPHLCDVLANRRMIAPLSLLERTISKLPPAAAVELQGRAERVKGYAEAVRDLADEAGDPEMVRQMLAEVGADAVALAEAGLELRRQHSRALKMAEARAAALAEEVKAAKAEAARHERAIELVDERILRPCCEAAGKGDTLAVEALTGRVSLSWTSGRTEVEPEALDFLPDEFVRVTREPDKAAIKAAIKGGAVFYGVQVVRERRVEVAG